MMTSVAQSDGLTSPHRARCVDAERPVVRVKGLVPLLFALSFATGLPPDALKSPPAVAWPTIHPGADAVVSVADLATVLGWPAEEVGRGRVMLGEVDERLDGLVVSLEAFRVVDVGGALVAIGIVRPDRAAHAGRAIADLWRLARESSVQYGASCAHPGLVGNEVFLAVYRRIAQLAWLTGRRLATVTVTRLDGDQDRMIRAARVVAALAEDRIALQDSLDDPRPA
jgi:hypothetical protein